mgnify:CR=1 FL=1
MDWTLPLLEKNLQVRGNQNRHHLFQLFSNYRYQKILILSPEWPHILSKTQPHSLLDCPGKLLVNIYMTRQAKCLKNFLISNRYYICLLILRSTYLLDMSFCFCAKRNIHNLMKLFWTLIFDQIEYLKVSLFSVKVNLSNLYSSAL